MKMKKQQEGFTLIELVMVIVILGILAAFALPRFANLSGNARTAAVQGIGANVQSAAAIVHSQALVSNLASAAAATVSLEGQVINIKYGYPAASDIASAAQFTPTAADYTTTTTAGPPATIQWDKTGASTPANCSVLYTEASSTTAPATVATTVTGCP